MNESKQGQSRNHRYFVMRIAPNHSHYATGQIFEIQILDSRGRAKYVGYVGEAENELSIEGHIVPFAVLETAHRQQEGQGDYVNEEGESIPAF